MERLSRLWNWMLWMLFFIVGFYIVFAGGRRFWSGDFQAFIREGKTSVQRVCQREFARCLFPGLFLEYAEDEEIGSPSDWYIKRVMEMHPLYRLQYGAKQAGGMENASTYEILVTGGVHDENELDENGDEYDMETLAQAENEKALEKKTEEEQEQSREEEPTEEEAEEAPVTVAAGTIYNMEELSDFEFLFENFYTMDKTTTISPEDLNAETLLAKDMRIDKSVEGPQILIYHTHASEGYADSKSGEVMDTVRGPGEALAEYLRGYGYTVYHDMTAYDRKDGKDNRNQAYSTARPQIEAFLEEHPEVQVVIDLHRDGGAKRVATVNGKKTAQVMLFNGLCRNASGPIDYLENKNLSGNLAFSLQTNLVGRVLYPDLMFRIYLKNYRYNQHFRERCMLIELGTDQNTVEEAYNAMEPLAQILDTVLRGQ